MEDGTPWTSITVSWQEDNALCLQSRCCRSIRHPSIFLNLVSNFLCSAFLLCVTVSKVRLLLLIVFEYGMITVNLKCLIKCPQEGPYVILCLTRCLNEEEDRSSSSYRTHCVCKSDRFHTAEVQAKAALSAHTQDSLYVLSWLAAEGGGHQRSAQGFALVLSS